MDVQNILKQRFKQVCENNKFHILHTYETVFYKPNALDLGIWLTAYSSSE